MREGQGVADDARRGLRVRRNAAGGFEVEGQLDVRAPVIPGLQRGARVNVQRGRRWRVHASSISTS